MDPSGLNRTRLTKVDRQSPNWTEVDLNTLLMWLNKSVVIINITFSSFIYIYIYIFGKRGGIHLSQLQLVFNFYCRVLLWAWWPSTSI